MATAEQIRANRANAKRSTGPKDTDRTRFNGLKHGLCAEQVVLPGEDRAAFEAEKQAWFDDWKPMSHTRSVLVERAAVASWKLRRATRVERARLCDVAAGAAHEFDLRRKEVVEGGLHLLPRNPAEALARMRSHASGLDRLIGLWDELAAAVDSGWTSRADHHDRLLNLLGHPAGSEPKGLDAARASLALLDAGAAGEPEAAALIRGLCAERAAEFRRERSEYLDPEVYRRHLIDAAIAPTTKDAQLLHRYEREHEKALHAAIRQLTALEKSGVDLPDEPEPAPEPAPEAVTAPVVPEESATNHEASTVTGKSASVGAAPVPAERPGDPAGASGGRRGPIGAVAGRGPAPNRR